MDKTRSLLKNTAVFAIGNIGSKVVSFLLVPLYTIYLSKAEYGLIDLITTLGLLITPLLMLNIHEAVLRFSIEKGSDKNKIVSISFIFLLLNFILSIVCFIVFKQITDYRDYAISIAILFFSLALYPTVLCYARGTEQIKKYSGLSIAQTLLFSVFNILFLAFFNMNVQGYLISYLLSNLFVSVVGIFITGMYKYVFPLKIDKEYFKPMIKYCSFLIPNSILWWIINSSDKVMLKYFLGNESVGIFAIAYKIPSILLVLMSVFIQAWHLTAMKEEDHNSLTEYTNKLFKIVISFLFALSSFLLLFVKVIMKYYVSEQYYVAWQYMPLLFLCFIVCCLGNFVSISFSKAKDSKNIMFAALIGATINILSNIIFIPMYGINGASIASFVSYFAILMYSLIVSKKYLHYKAFTLKNILYLLAFVLQICVTYIADDILMYVLSSLLFIFIFVLSINEFKYMFVEVKKILKKN